MPRVSARLVLSGVRAPQQAPCSPIATSRSSGAFPPNGASNNGKSSQCLAAPDELVQQAPGVERDTQTEINSPLAQARCSRRTPERHLTGTCSSAHRRGHKEKVPPTATRPQATSPFNDRWRASPATSTAATRTPYATQPLAQSRQTPQKLSQRAVHRERDAQHHRLLWPAAASVLQATRPVHES